MSSRLCDRDISALARCGTRTGLTNVLQILQRSGLLETDDSERKIRRTLQRGVVHHATTMTPYGPVVQKVKLDIPGMTDEWEYCNPVAYFYHLSTLNEAFGQLMQSLPSEINIVVYVDEIVPGNPFRHEKARKLQAIYFVVLEWPEWVLSRSGMWPVFGVLRSKLVDQFPGGLSGFMKKCLSLMFIGENSFQHPACVCIGSNRHHYHASYGGLLADEDALKKVHNYTGAQGIKICMDCANLVSHTDDDVCPPGLVLLNVTTLEGLDFNTNEDIWEMAEVLRDDVAAGRDVKGKETRLGLQFNPDGLLYDRPMRTIHRPIDHYLRDWMHTLVSAGTANQQTKYLLEYLKDVRDVPIDIVQAYSMEVTLPSKYGKVSPEWIHSNRLKVDGFASFASTMLHIIPIIHCFLVDCIQPHLSETDVMHEHITCWKFLVDIVGLLSSGAEWAVLHVDRLQELIQGHHQLFVRLYPSTAVKPKFHHMLHLPNLYRRIQRVISCFVAERKHRSVKKAALHVFRYLEHTALVDVISQQCNQILDGHDLFKPRLLIRPTDFFYEDMNLHVQRSSHAALECGELARDDVIYVHGGMIARIVCFWSDNDMITAQCHECARVDNDFIYRDTCTVTFIDATAIVDALCFRSLDDGDFRICLPYKAYFC